VLVAHERGSRTEHVQCTIYRDRSTAHTMLYPEYQLVADDTKRPLLLARKMSMNRTSNYHVWDLTRGVVGAKLTKKSGNYLGKLRALNSARTEYVIVTSAASGREELGGIVFERLTIFDQLKAGSQPRKMMVLVPALDTNSIPVPTRPAQGDEPIAALLKSPQQGNSSGMFVLESKMPSFENGNYRLNFRGRVNLPSVKNFQLVSPADVGEIICQFGKVNDDKFHLDFKAPLNAVQAFCLSLTQFNL
jgi:tubby-related protein 1